jgi:hypothetical protein
MNFPLTFDSVCINMTRMREDYVTINPDVTEYIKDCNRFLRGKSIT